MYISLLKVTAGGAAKPAAIEKAHSQVLRSYGVVGIVIGILKGHWALEPPEAARILSYGKTRSKQEAISHSTI